MAETISGAAPLGPADSRDKFQLWYDGVQPSYDIAKVHDYDLGARLDDAPGEIGHTIVYPYERDERVTRVDDLPFVRRVALDTLAAHVGRCMQERFTSPAGQELLHRYTPILHERRLEKVYATAVAQGLGAEEIEARLVAIEQEELQYEYPGALVAGKMEPHPHTHRMPSLGNRRWLRVMGSAFTERLTLTQDEFSEVRSLLAFSGRQEAAVSRELRDNGVPTPNMLRLEGSMTAEPRATLQYLDKTY